MPATTQWLFGARPGLAGRLPFASRSAAGAVLAQSLDRYRDTDALVLGIPRGGVPVAAAVARALGAELDVVVARKLGAPGYPEVAIGAITADGTRILDQESCARLRVSVEYIEYVSAREEAEARRREARFRGTRPPPRIRGRPVIIVDDGLATGATMIAAVDAVRHAGPERVVVAVPVCAREACRALEAVADDVVCFAQPEPFYGVGAFYESFPQLEDEEVVRALAAARPDSRANPDMNSSDQ